MGIIVDRDASFSMLPVPTLAECADLHPAVGLKRPPGIWGSELLKARAMRGD